MGLVLCWALLSVPPLLSLRATLSPHGVSVAPHHRPDDHGAQGLGTTGCLWVTPWCR